VKTVKSKIAPGARSCKPPPPPDPITAKLLLKWFDEALGRDDPRPPQQALEAMAIEINFHAERIGGFGNPLQEEYALRLMNLRYAAQNFRAALSAYQAINPPYPPDNSFDTLVMVGNLLSDIRISDAEHTQPQPRRGHPKEDWLVAGRTLASLIAVAMRNVAYKGSLDKKTPESVTAQVGASMINHLFRRDRDIDAVGFATGMKNRDRSKAARGLSASLKIALSRVRILDDK